MKLEQSKFLKPTFIFEHDEKILKVTAKNLLSRNSFEVQISDLSSNRFEEARFALGYLLVAVGCGLWGISSMYVGIQQGMVVHGGGLYVLGVLGFLLAGFSLHGFNKRTYDSVMLCYKDTGNVAVSFYRTVPSEEEVNHYIASIKNAIEGGQTTGFNA